MKIKDLNKTWMTYCFLKQEAGNLTSENEAALLLFICLLKLAFKYQNHFSFSNRFLKLSNTNFVASFTRLSLT